MTVENAGEIPRPLDAHFQFGLFVPRVSAPREGVLYLCLARPHGEHNANHILQTLRWGGTYWETVDGRCHFSDDSILAWSHIPFSLPSTSGHFIKHREINKCSRESEAIRKRIEELQRDIADLEGRRGELAEQIVEMRNIISTEHTQ